MGKKILAEIISFVTKKPWHWLFTNEKQELTESEYQEVSKLLKLFQSGMPLAYIFGVKEFYSRDFIVSEDVLIPRIDSELIVKLTLDEIQRKKEQKEIKIKKRKKK